MNKEVFEPKREYRAVMQFSAEEVLRLAPGPLDPVALGCPASLFARVLEKRAALRARGWRPPVVTKPARVGYKPLTDEEVRLAALELQGTQERNVSPEVLKDRARREKQAKVQQLIKSDYDAQVEAWWNKTWW